MDIEGIKKEKDRIVGSFGPWTSHSIRLADNVYTTDEPWPDTRLRQIMHIASDVTDRPLETLRIVDLACLEGLFGIEFALHGAKVLAIEGREANFEKARFAKDVLSLHNLDLALDDVRNLRREKHGSFDVVLCLGILYHLDAPDLFPFVERIYEVCDRVAIIDTHLSLKDEDSYVWNGKPFWGRYSIEHDAEASSEEKLKALWNSLDNPRSFMLTRASLCNLLRHVGFTSVYECHSPSWSWYSGYPCYSQSSEVDANVVEMFRDRMTLVAIKGHPQTLIASPAMNALQEIALLEKPKYDEPPTKLRRGCQLLCQGKVLTLMNVFGTHILRSIKKL